MAANSGRRGSPRRREQMMQVIQEQTSVAANLVNRLAQIGDPVQYPPPEAPNRVIYDLIKLKPPPFTGGHDPLEAQYWLDELNKNFEILKCTDEQKVAFAVYMLKGAANNWWNLEKSFMMAKGTPMNWEHFQELFLGRYFPNCIRDQKELEFVQLQQGVMSVAEYLAKFEELFRFSYHFHYCQDEKWKMNKFKRGLRSDIQLKFVAQPEFTSFATLVRKSYIAEDCLKKYQEERQLKRQRVPLNNIAY